MGAFQNLEDMISSVGTTAIQIGKTLDALSSQLNRAQASSRVVSTYLALRKSDKSLQELRSRKMSTNEAQFLRNLLQICRDVDLKGSKDTRGVVEKFTESIERDVLADFDEAYRKGDLNSMRSCAEILHEFNGGSSVHRAFVNQHDFFIRRENIESEDLLGSDELWQVLPDPDADPPGLEPTLISLFREIKRCVKDEFLVINQIFPDPVTVKNLFLQRIFAQSIQSRLEEVLSYAENMSTLAYLRTLQSTHSVVGALVDALKSLPSTPAEEAQSISSVLKSNEEDLFVPYLETGKYIEKEKKSLLELCSSLLYKFTRFHDDRRSQKTTNYLDRLAGKITASRSDGSRMGGALLRLAGIERKSSVAREARDVGEQEIELNPADGELKTAYIKRMLKWHAEAVSRSVELSSGQETARDALALMSILFDIVVNAYLELWLDRVLDDTIATDARAEPDFAFFAGIKEATTISRLLFAYVDTVLIPLAGPSLSIRREMLQRQANNTARVNSKINALIQRSVDATLTCFTTILSRQQKRDFKPREDEINLATMQTLTNQQAVAFLSRVGKVAHQSLSGENVVSFLNEIGTRINDLLLDHFKKFSINATGGLLLTKDISRYQEVIYGWNISDLNPRFKFLLEIGSIFVVKPDVLRKLLHEGDLSKVKGQYLIPYLQCREDFYSHSLGNLVEGGNDIMQQVPAFLQATPFS